MRRLTLLFGVLVASCCVAPLLADTTKLQSILTNVNGTTQTDYTGYDTSGFNTTTGIGTLTFTFDPGPGGPYFFDVFFDHQLNLPFFNEFGTKLGTAAGNQTWEIGDSDVTNSDPNDTYVHTGSNALDNGNHLAGTTDDFLGTCVGAACNGDFAAALGFSFTLAAGQQEVITLSVSHTDPGSGLRLQDTHPVDGTNPTELSLFISGSATACDITDPNCGGGGGGTVPEPFSVVLLGTVIVFLMVTFRRRFAPGVK